MSLDDPYFYSFTNLDPNYQKGNLSYIDELQEILSTTDQYLTEEGEDDRPLKQIRKDVNGAFQILSSACSSQSIQTEIDNIVNCAAKTFSNFDVKTLGDGKCNLSKS